MYILYIFFISKIIIISISMKKITIKSHTNWIYSFFFTTIIMKYDLPDAGHGGCRIH